MLSAVDFPTLLGEVYSVVFILGGLFGGGTVVFTAHRRHVEHRKNQVETREIVDALVVTVKEQDETLARIEHKLTMNGKNTSNPADLLGLICDRLGIEIPS